MSMQRRTEDLTNAGAAPLCSLYNHPIPSNCYLYTAPFPHVFHKSGLSKYSKTNQNCTSCNGPLKALSVSTAAYAARPPSPVPKGCRI